MQCMPKTEVYSWRLSPVLKAELEEAAKAESKNLASLLEEITEDWLAHQKARSNSEDDSQKSIREAAMRFVGAIQGDDPSRSENVRSAVRARLAERYGR